MPLHLDGDRIVSIILLVGALILAIRSLPGRRRK